MSVPPEPLQPDHLPGFDGIELLRWPDQDLARRALERAGIPRILVLSGNGEPPSDLGFDEDWIRAPYRHQDLEARVRHLATLLRVQSSQGLWLDEQRVLHRGNRRVLLTAFEAVIAKALVSAEGEVVRRSHLEKLLWPGHHAPGPRAVDAVVYRLRGRCRGLGLSINTVRGEGFLLRVAASHKATHSSDQRIFWAGAPSS